MMHSLPFGRCPNFSTRELWPEVAAHDRFPWGEKASNCDLTFLAPNVDYNLVPDRPSTLLQQGRFLRVPMLLGDNYDECVLMSCGADHRGTSFVLKNTNTTQSVIDQVNDFEPVHPSNETINQLLELYPNEPALGS